MKEAKPWVDEVQNQLKKADLNSASTYSSYRKACIAFCDWCAVKHGCKSIEECKPYVIEYLQDYTMHSSAWSVYSAKYAIRKLYRVEDNDFTINFKGPERRRVDIKRSRGPISEVKDFDVEKHADKLAFACATGARRCVLLTVRYKDIFYKDGELYVHMENDKYGKKHDVKIMPKDEAFISSLIGKGDPDDRIFKSLPVRFPIQRCRRQFAMDYYMLYANHPKNIAEEDEYRCRNDLKDIVLDREAMTKIFDALGLESEHAVAMHYC